MILKMLKKYKSYLPYLMLIAGRAYFRLANLVLTAVLYHVWAKSIYGDYYSKIGIWFVIEPILCVGMGKCALKLLSVYKFLREILIREIILVSIAMSFIIIGITFILGHLLFRSLGAGFNVLDIMIILSSLVYGFSVTLQCISRAIGKNHYDYTVSFVLGSFVIVLALINIFGSMTPLAILWARTIFFAAISLCLAIIILKLYPMKRKYNRKFYKISILRITKESTFMALNNIIKNSSMSVINIVFRINGLFEAAADFNYVLNIGLFVFTTFYQYTITLFFPKIVGLARKGRKYFVERYRKKLLGFTATAFLFSVTAALIIILLGSGEIKYLFILSICALPTSMLYETILVFFEAALNKNLAITTSVCFSGLVICGISALLLIPQIQAAGALFTLILTNIVPIGVFLWLINKSTVFEYYEEG